MGSKANFKQAPVHWPREITKAKLSQAKPLFIHIFSLKQCKKEGKMGTQGSANAKEKGRRNFQEMQIAKKREKN